jgi:hypothetical protein
LIELYLGAALEESCLLFDFMYQAYGTPYQSLDKI